MAKDAYENLAKALQKKYPILSIEDARRGVNAYIREICASLARGGDIKVIALDPAVLSHLAGGGEVTIDFDQLNKADIIGKAIKKATGK